MKSVKEEKNVQVSFLKERLHQFLEVLESIDPADTDIDDIDRLIEMIDELEVKCRELNDGEK